LIAASRARGIDLIAVSTDCPRIMEEADRQAAKVIVRPPELAQSDSEMSDVIVHAAKYLEDEYLERIDIMVTMHANCGVHRDGLIDECVAALDADPDLDACVSAREVWDLHPYRLKKVTADGTLVPWVVPPQGSDSNNRQAIRERAVVLDGACRAFRRHCLDLQGQPPFRYLGNRIAWVDNPGGLDVHSEADLVATRMWLERQGEQAALRAVNEYRPGE
jgi:hypothetical protein